MGSCASNLYDASKGGRQSRVVNIVHIDGKLQQFKEAIKAEDVLSQNPNCFLCCSESMFVGSPMSPLPSTEELQLDNIYFLVPLSKSQVPLSLQDLCALAIKANTALSKATTTTTTLKPYSVSQRKFQTHPILSNVSLGY